MDNDIHMRHLLLLNSTPLSLIQHNIVLLNTLTLQVYSSSGTVVVLMMSVVSEPMVVPTTMYVVVFIASVRSKRVGMIFGFNLPRTTFYFRVTDRL